MGFLLLAGGLLALALVAGGSSTFNVIAGKTYRFIAVASPAPGPQFEPNVLANLQQAGAKNVSIVRTDSELRVSYTAMSTATQEMKNAISIGGLRFELESVKEV